MPFTLRASLKELGPQETEGRLDFDGEFNAMMAMMIKNPLSNFLEALASKLNNW